MLLGVPLLGFALGMVVGLGGWGWREVAAAFRVGVRGVSQLRWPSMQGGGKEEGPASIRLTLDRSPMARDVRGGGKWWWW